MHEYELPHDPKILFRLWAYLAFSAVYLENLSYILHQRECYEAAQERKKAANEIAPLVTTLIFNEVKYA